MSYFVTSINDTEKFLELCEEWNSLYKASVEQDFYFTHDWFYPLLNACSSLPDGELTVFVFRRGGKLCGLMPCCLVNRKKRFFTVNTLELYGNVYTPRRGAIVRKGEEQAVVNAFVDYLCNDFVAEWDVIEFLDLSKKDNVIRLLIEALVQKKIKVTLHAQFENVRTYLGNNGWENFFTSLGKKLRQNIRTGVNKFHKNGSIVVWMVDNEHQDVDSALNDYYQVYGESWKQQEIDPNFHRKLATYLTAKNKLRLFILYYREGESEQKEFPYSISSIKDGLYVGKIPPGNGYLPIAANYFVVDGSVAYYLKTAYHGKFSKFSSGTVLFWFSTKYFIETDHCSIIDHQKGKEEYKLKWGDVYETRYLLKAANQNSRVGKAEMWINNSFLPLVKKIRNFCKK